MLPSESTVLGYGGADLGNLHGALTDDEAWAILEAAWGCGIRHFDTAPHYGLGLSERRLGAFLRTKPRAEYTLSTKAGRLIRPNPEARGGHDDEGFIVPDDLRREWDFSADGIRTSLDESLDRLGLDRVDVLYLHDPERHDMARALGEALPALVDLRATGTVGEIGVGSMVTDALERSVRAADLDVVMVAGRYTLLEQPAAGVVADCQERGTAVVAASVFNSGLLATRTPSRADRYEYDAVPGAVWDRLQRILAVCDARDVPLPAAALQYPLRAPAVRTVVVGGSRPEHLVQNAELMALPLPDALWQDLEAAGLIPPTPEES